MKKKKQREKNLKIVERKVDTESKVISDVLEMVCLIGELSLRRSKNLF